MFPYYPRLQKRATILWNDLDKVQLDLKVVMVQQCKIPILRFEKQQIWLNGYDSHCLMLKR